MLLQTNKNLLMHMRDYVQPKMISIFFWALASGIPILLITSTLSARLLQAGVPLIKISLFAATTLPYSLKFLGSPIVERFSIPLLTNYVGHARAWMLIAMSGAMLCLIWSASIDIQGGTHLTQLFLASFSAACCAAVCDIAEPELRIELLDKHELPLGTACYTNGYCLGEVFAGGGALIIAGFYNWRVAYYVIISLMLVGIVTILLKKHRPRTINIINEPINISLMGDTILKRITRLFLFILRKWITEPIRPLVACSGWQWLVLVVIFYYANSYMLLMMTNPFYLQAGFTTVQIGALRGLPGTGLLILGGLVGGLCCRYFGILRVLKFSALIYIIDLLIMVSLAQLVQQNTFIVYTQLKNLLFGFSILLMNFVDGFSVVAYISLIASFCHPPYTVSQNALLTSFMAASKIVFSSIAGYFVKQFGWAEFFTLTALTTLPALFFINKLGICYPSLEWIKNKIAMGVNN